MVRTVGAVIATLFIGGGGALGYVAQEEPEPNVTTIEDQAALEDAIAEEQQAAEEAAEQHRRAEEEAERLEEELEEAEAARAEAEAEADEAERRRRAAEAQSSYRSTYSSPSRSSSPSYSSPSYSSPSYPSSSSLSGGYNAAGCPRNQYVSGYTRSDGTYVDSYYRNSPNDGCGGG